MKLTPQNMIKGMRYLKHYGIKDFWIKLQERMEPEEIPYGPWREQQQPSQEELARQRREQKSWKKRPRVSIVVPAFQTPEVFLRQMIESVERQTYDNWQLCIADGSRDNHVEKIVSEYTERGWMISYLHLEENKGIAENTNAALKLAEGEWIGLLDHDDILAEQALYEVVKAINKHEDVEMVYTDEDKVNLELTEYYRPHFKPDFSIDLLRSNNYITHFLVVKQEIAEKTGGFRQEFDGAQDYDFIFRCAELAKKIYHVPEVLYHWREHPDSTAADTMSKQYAYTAGQRAIEAHLARTGTEGQVFRRKDMGFYEVRYPVQGKPLVSIMIPNKDHVKLLDQCLKSLEKSTYTNYEVIIVENNSEDPETFTYYRKISSEQIKIVIWEKGFNYSAINNFGFQHAKGDYIILLNNDIEIINPAWIEEMLGNSQRPEVGIVGAKLYYPDDTIQHAGIVLGIGEGLAAGGIAGAMFVGMKRSRSGYMHKASIQLNYSAVTAACMMVSRRVYEEIQGFDEELSVAFNDVDFCLKAVEKGYLVVYNPRVEAYHHESKSRGKEDTKEKVQRFQQEIDRMRTKWMKVLKEGDPYYNKNLSLSKVNYGLRMIKK